MRIKNTRRNRRIGLGASVVLLGAFAIAGVTSTGAYFSDAHNGNISGTVGSIKITGSGGAGANNLDLSFDRLLPGQSQTVTVGYTNTGNSPEDVFLHFGNADALHALNDLGRYGEFHVVANGTHYFDSANLNDNQERGTCGPLSPSGCWPLPATLKVASNVAPGATGTIQFTFMYAAALSGQTAAGGGVWNAYPVNAPTASGLPYTLVATQVGQTP